MRVMVLPNGQTFDTSEGSMNISFNVPDVVAEMITEADVAAAYEFFHKNPLLFHTSLQVGPDGGKFPVEVEVLGKF